MSDEAETWMGFDRRAVPFVQSGILLGIGLGGFFDGIVFHQILQIHHMVSAQTDPTVVEDLRLNVLLDGAFHVVAYLFTILGIVQLWRARLDPYVPGWGRVLFGSAILGWGLFNVVEGLVDHHLLELHHVWADGPGPVLLWDVAFLVWGMVFLVGGYVIARGGGGAESGTDVGVGAGEE